MPTITKIVLATVITMSSFIVSAIPAGAHDAVTHDSPCPATKDQENGSSEGISESSAEMSAASETTENTLNDQASTVLPTVTEAVETPPQKSVVDVTLNFLRLNEVLPDPAGSDLELEFIEFNNIGGHEADLTGWSIRDAKGAMYPLPPVILPAGTLRAFSQSSTKVKLTNSGATFWLVDPDGKNVEAVEYGPAKEGLAYAKTMDGRWKWTEKPTPGLENAFPETPVPGTVASVVQTPVISSNQENVGAVTLNNKAEVPVAVTPGPGPGQAPILKSSSSPILSEVLPDPSGDDSMEWFELFNDSDIALPLSGWVVDDGEGGSTPYRFPADMLIGPRSFLIIDRASSKLAFNNDEDAFRLINPDGKVVAEVRYEDVPEGMSYASVGGTWRWTTPTPGTANSAPPEETDDPTISQLTESVENKPDDSGPVSLDELDVLETGREIEVSGTVTLAPGTIGTATFALQEEGGGGGVFARITGKDRPALGIGDVLTIRGRISKRGETVTIFARSTDIVVHGTSEVVYESVNAGDINEFIGRAVSVEGEVTYSSRKRLRIADEKGAVEIDAIPSQGVLPLFTAGQRVTLDGVVRLRRGEPELIVRLGGVRPNILPEKNSAEENARSTDALPSRAPLVFSSGSGKEPIYAALLLPCIVLAYIFFRRHKTMRDRMPLRGTTGIRPSETVANSLLQGRHSQQPLPSVMAGEDIVAIL